MMSDDKKSWEKPWYPKEIAENASNWSFSADLSLLKYLEVFSEDLLDKATTIDNNVNNLLNNLDKASISLDIAKNKFLGLSNTQFIESRVYEDDETVLPNEEKSEEEEPNKNNADEMNKNAMKLAALRGIEVINKYFDKVEVADSDSEEESGLTSFVLRPKDPYIDRPLPYVIGTEKWYKKSHVGLEDSSSESEDEKVSEKYSESDSESDIGTSNRSQAKSISGSGSSEADLSNKLDLPVANSTFNDTNKPEDYLGSSEDYISVSVQAPISQDSFAEQLAAKLGNVINNRAQEPSVNTRPIQKASNYDRYENIFSDEPPPLDEFDDELSPKSKDQGIFSGGDGLFDDLDDDEPFWGGIVTEQSEKDLNVAQKPTLDLFAGNGDTKANDQRTTPQSESFRNELNGKLNKTKELGIFDDEIESEEDSLFRKGKTTSHNTNKEESLFGKGDNVNNAKKDARSKIKEADSLFGDEVSKTVDTTKRKALIGGVQVIDNPSLFSGGNIKKLLKNRVLSSSESSENEVPKDEVDKVNPTKEIRTIKNEGEQQLRKESKINNLFDDDEDDLFKDDLFSNFSSKKTTSNLFGKSDSLFDDLDEPHDEDRLENIKNSYSAENVEDPMTKSVDPKESPMASDMSEKKTEEIKPKEEPKKFEDFLEQAENPFSIKSNRGLFLADDDSDSDDLFSSKRSKIISKNRIIENVSSTSISHSESNKIQLPKEVKRSTKKVPSLFDDEDDNEDDNLFASSILQSEKSASQKLETKSDLSKMKKLFEEDDEDDIFSTMDLSSDGYTSMFDGGKLFATNLEEEFEDKAVSSDKLVKYEVSIKEKDILQSPNLDETLSNSDIFQSDSLQKKAVSNQAEIDKSKDAPSKRNTVIDKLFADDDLFETKVRKVSQNVRIIETEDSFEDNSNDNLSKVGLKSTSTGKKTMKSIEDSHLEEAVAPQAKEPQIENKEAPETKDIKPEAKIEDIIDNSLPNNLFANIISSSVREVAEESQQNFSRGHLVEENIEDNLYAKSTDRIPSINIFDPNPPPDLDDWDSRFEQNFDDDIYTFDNSESLAEHRSSIFDREPPPNFNESSGIVRDQSARLESDMSSFIPSAMSTRKFSSDLFNEEQSSDSLFTPKNRFRSFESNVVLPESTEGSISNVDITPSGRLEDLYTENSEPRQQKSVTFEDDLPKKSERVEDKTKTGGDMETSPKEEKIEKPQPALSKKPNLKKKLSLPLQKVNRPSKNPDKEEKTNLKKKTFISHENENETNHGKDEKTTPVEELPKPKKLEHSEGKGSPAKLKHNLDINVLALLPGAGKPPKRQPVAARENPPPPQRSTSLDFEEQKTGGSFERVDLSKKSKDDSIILENNSGNMEVLESVTKTRARGPVRRRPSTKRGRDAIRNSCIDFTFVADSGIENRQTQNEIPTNTSNETRPFKNEPSPISTTTEIETKESLENEILHNNSGNTKEVLVEPELFGSHNENGDFFRRNVEEVARKHLFSDDTDSDDIFSGLKNKNSELFESEGSEDLNQRNMLQPSEGSKRPVFANEEETVENGGQENEDRDNDKEVQNTAIRKTLDETNARNELESDLKSDRVKVDLTRKVEVTRVKDFFDDDTDDDDLFSNSKSSIKKTHTTTSSNSKSVKLEGSELFGGTRRLSSVKAGNIGFSEDEEGDIFGEKEVRTKKIEVSQRLPFGVDDDGDLFGEAPREKEQANSGASITSRRLKTSSLKKLENTILTGDDPLNALNN